MSNAVYITGLAAFLPNEPIGNDEVESVLGLINGAKSRARAIVQRNNGIRSRYYAIDRHSGRQLYNNAQLTSEAIRRLSGEAFSVEQIDCLSCGTSSPDQLMPGHGVMVHGELGNPPCEVNSSAGICVAGMTALKYAWLCVRAGDAANAVATGSELASTFMLARNFEAESETNLEKLRKRPEIAFEKDFLRWMLSDGAGAALLQDRPREGALSLRIDWMEINSFASRYPTCMYAGADRNADLTLRGWREYASMDELGKQSVLAVKQDVRLLDEAIIRATIEEMLPAVAAKHDLHPDQIDHFLPHLSSEYFRPRLVTGLQNINFHIPQEKWFTNLAEKGNTGSASIYIMLEELFHSGRLRKGERVLCFVPESGRFSSAFMLLTVV